jgi:hypothetical protein
VNRRHLLASIGCALLLMLGATSVEAQAAPSLDGEVLFKFFPVCAKDPSGLDGPQCAAAIENPPPRVTQVQCNPGGNSTLSFSLDGTATGPYPGTFHEDVSVTIGPQELPPFGGIGGPFTPSTFGFNAGPIARWDATFTIQSGATTITGTKSLAAQIPANAGFCATLNNSTGGGFTIPSSGYLTVANAENLTYRAMISGPDGTFVDTGNSESIVRETWVVQTAPGLDRVRSVVGEFGQSFQSTGSEAGKPGLGCGDKNHVHVREGECKDLRA